MVCDLSGIKGNLLTDSTCVVPQATTPPGWPGDVCVTGTDCITTLCVGGICVAKIAGQTCTPYQCANGYFCSTDNFTCKVQIASGSFGCYGDLDCANNSGCNKVGSAEMGVCIQYFSVKNGLYVSCNDTIEDDINYLCSSGF
jgi:hypothetical protein